MMLKPAGRPMEVVGTLALLVALSAEMSASLTLESPALSESVAGEAGAPASTELVSAGNILSGIGPHAVSAGTSNSAATVTSHTRWRAPADARCIDKVMPMATSRMSVALTSSITIEMFELVSEPRAEMSVDGIASTSRSDERGESCCAVA